MTYIMYIYRGYIDYHNFFHRKVGKIRLQIAYFMAATNFTVILEVNDTHFP